MLGLRMSLPAIYPLSCGHTVTNQRFCGVRRFPIGHTAAKAGHAEAKCDR